MTAFQHSYRCTIWSPPEYEQLVAEIAVDGQVVCLLLCESPEADVALKFEAQRGRAMALKEFIVFLQAAANYLKDGKAQPPEIVLSNWLASRSMSK